ncbi:hypothetical protein LCGC14_1267800 [marine sediment metagenome]|uniref:Uncharacterized protein n=1 Tax=marine sediment metagenome TaxID=412755 RepID=A0A0F9KZ20_9ZZZZ
MGILIIGFCNRCEKEIDEKDRNTKIIDDKGKFKTKLLLNRFCHNCWKDIVKQILASGIALRE